MKRAAYRLAGVAVLAVMVLLALTGLALAKSLYAVVNNGSTSSFILAYNINADGTLTFQNSSNVPGLGTLNMALDGASNTLFVTDGTSTVQLVNAATMTYRGPTTAPGASNLGAIVVDNQNNLVYAVEPATNRLFVYQWNPGPGTFTAMPGSPVDLLNVGGSATFGYGLALDQAAGFLYVGNNSKTIPYYRTSDWSRVGTRSVFGTAAIGVAVDSVRRFLYSGAGLPDYNGLDYFNLTTPANKGGLDLGTQHGVAAIAVDEDTGLVYIVDGPINGFLLGYRHNPSTAFDPVQSAISVGNATGLAITPSLNPLNLQKSAGAATVNPGGLLTYTLRFDNLNNPNPVTNVILTDNLPPETVFVSAVGGVYNATTRTVTWNIGNLPAGAPSRNRGLVVRVQSTTPVDTQISNTATIDSDDTPPTTRNVQTLVTVSNPLNLQKSAGAARVNPGGLLTYTLRFDNRNNASPVHNVILTDNLPPETAFISAVGGTYNPSTHTVTWNIGNLVAGAPSRSRRLVVRVLADTPDNTRIRNTATIVSDDTPPATASVRTLVTVPALFSLAFPIQGYTPHNAPVIAVLDHSVFDTHPVKFYVKDNRVKAFNDEMGRKVFGSHQLEGLWDGYMNSSGSNFLSGILNYIKGPYLYYDGHPGYDYQIPKGSRILATARGTLRIAKTDPVNGGGWQGYKTFYIKHRVVTATGIVDYYTWYLYVNPTKRILDQINQNGFAPVLKGEFIGQTYNGWIHVDFRRGGIGHANIIDPYEAGLWEPLGPGLGQ